MNVDHITPDLAQPDREPDRLDWKRHAIPEEIERLVAPGWRPRQVFGQCRPAGRGLASTCEIELYSGA